MGQPITLKIMATENKEKILFDLVNELDETLTGDIHIIDMTDEYPCDEDDKKYRVYHSEGYCFDISRETTEEEEDVCVYYHFYAEWEGFDECTVDNAIKLFNQ